MFKKTVSLGLILAFLAAVEPALRAGGRIDTIDITGNVPSPLPGLLEARIVSIQWDIRTIPVQFRMNSTLDPIPNPLGPAFLSVADARATLQKSLDTWNNIPTSYIRMDITGTVANPGLRGFDMINEVTFRSANNFGAIAASAPITLIADSVLEDGDFIDGDSDADVSSAITVATDVDNDGDLEFPAGFYKAGTILDNDVFFNTKAAPANVAGLRFTVLDAAIDTVIRSVDLECVAVHEFGHALGLNHAMNNQKGPSDGTSATMFPFIDTGDPASELAGRSLDSDDLAWASHIYPEGSAATGLPALQAGDVAFSQVYGVITGDTRHGPFNAPLVGGSVSAIDKKTRTLIATGFSGTSRAFFNPLNGQITVQPGQAAFHLVNGRYSIPAPKGSFVVGIEAVDGAPAGAGSFGLNVQIGAAHGLQNFNEERYNNNSEDVLEVRPDESKNVPVIPGQVSAGINITTNRTFNINNFGALAAIGFTNSPAGRMYAMRFPKAQIDAILPGQDILLHSGLFETHVVDASVPVQFARALLVSGQLVNPTTGAITLDLLNPLVVADGFLGDDGDFGSFNFKNPHELGKRVRAAMALGTIQDLFLVLQIPTTTPFPGVSGQAPLVGLSNPVAGVADTLSYISNDGGATWIRVAFRFRFSLVVAEPPK